MRPFFHNVFRLFRRSIVPSFHFLLLAFVPALSPASNGPFAATNTASLRALTRLQMNRGRPFSLSGIITMADPQRNIFVLQDSAGAMLVHPDTPIAATPGTLVDLVGQSGAPYVVNFPKYPFSPSHAEIRMSFEVPTNWGDYHLTRMAGFLHPLATGDYTFWIASDNSSELWLSPDEDPRNVRMIATIPAGSWVGVREWSRYPSQRSDPIRLEAGHAYYIEAFREQVELDEHLAVAWAGPNIKQSIIEGRYLTPWVDVGVKSSQQPAVAPSNSLSSLDPLHSSSDGRGILAELWTNFTCGNLLAITPDRPVDLGVTARGVRIRVLETNRWPAPVQIDLATQLASENNYQWVHAQGRIAFAAAENSRLTLELTADQNRVLAVVNDWHRDPPLANSNLVARIVGVCEGSYGPGGELMPGVIRAVSGDNVTIFELQDTNTPSAISNSVPVNTGSQLGGYFSARGVVTFNGIVLDKPYLVVQDNNAGIFIVPPENFWPPATKLLIGDSVQIGGNLLPTRYAARLRPRVVNRVGQHTLPPPALPTTQPGSPRYRDGQWTELEGVVRSVQSNGLFLLKRSDDSVAVWLSADNEPLIDSTLRLRGVMCLDSPHSPMLLVPSADFVQILEAPSANVPIQQISRLKAAAGTNELSHRVRIAGAVTYRDDKLLFVQDDSGAVRVQVDGDTSVIVGDAVEVLGYPEPFVNSIPALMNSRIQQLPAGMSVKPRRLDLTAPLRDMPNLALVRVKASLLGQKNFGDRQALEVQAGQRVFEALLMGDYRLPSISPGSLVDLTGVCAMEIISAPGSPQPGWDSASIGTVRLLLRSPADIVVLRGPPWWTWKKVVVLIVVLVLLLTAALLRVALLRRRFEKQQAARLAFARQLLENQEKERRRIAANLHDTLGQNLLAIKNQTHLAMQSASDTTLQKRLDDISGTVLHALEEVRQITHDLRPYQLDRLGLSQAIRSLVRKVSEGCPIELASHIDNIDGFFPKDSEINIYRIVQEGINNVIKHSQATEAAVVLKVETGTLRISIRDNGRGLPPGQTTEDGSTSGFGISGIRERARIMKGQVEIDAAAGQGFNLKIEIPVQHAPWATGTSKVTEPEPRKDEQPEKILTKDS
jgi:signal transduction histidine kinase